MDYINKYIDRKVIHFNKWSNTSYAIFNSIGRIIHIGFLSQIIYGLMIAKSIIGYGFIELISGFKTEAELDEDRFSQLEIKELINPNQFASCLIEKVLNDNSHISNQLFTLAIYNIQNKRPFWAFFNCSKYHVTKDILRILLSKMAVIQLKILI